MERNIFFLFFEASRGFFYGVSQNFETRAFYLHRQFCTPMKPRTHGEMPPSSDGCGFENAEACFNSVDAEGLQYVNKETQEGALNMRHISS